MEKKIPRSDYRFVERLLYQQKTHDTVIAELKAELDEMIPSSTSSYVTFDHNKKNPELTQPERIADKRLYSVRGKYLQEEIARRKRHQAAITEAMNALNDTESQLVWLYYHLEKTPRDCWRTMGYEKSRWYEIKNETVCKVARFLGLA
ncbi:MAG TPA: hypothetical protein VFC74_06660 [Oscillospiraceae bacterium]|nr:hypothetical protein [Oscillospiraceae bacterium]